METILCPSCKQEIPADSRKCHYCREWVNRKAMFARQIPWLLPFLAFMVAMPWLMDLTMFRDKQFWQHPDVIKILNHRAGEGEKGGLCVIGTMKNASDTPWDSVTVQVDYFDAKNQLVDTSQDYNSETLAPGQERSFKVTFERKQKGVEYDHYRVFVAGADDASRF